MKTVKILLLTFVGLIVVGLTVMKSVVPDDYKNFVKDHDFVQK